MQGQKWNSDWLFWEERNAFALVWSVPADAAAVELPHDAMREKPPRPDCPNGGNTGYYAGGNYVYVKTLFVPGEWREKSVSLRFDGVYQNALVYVNGCLAGGRPYGYSRFDVPLGDFLRFGEENEIRVLVRNSAGPNSRWYTGSGIYRDVWLYAGGPVHIPPDGLTVDTREAGEECAVLSLSAKIVNRGGAARDVTARLRVLGPEGECAAQARIPLHLPAGGETLVRKSLTVSRPALWSAETPELYRCELRLCQGEEELDLAHTHFGIRTLTLDPRRGLRVNGQSVKLRGACIHHDNGPLGAVSLRDAEVRRIRMLKRAGFNAVRMAHCPMSPELLYACDRVGMYVMDEAFDMWTRPKTDCDYALFFSKWWREDLTAMVEKDRNHPSVIFYSLGNEIPEIGTPQGAALGREMSRLVKQLDPTRFTLAAVNGVFAAGEDLDRIMADLTAAPDGAPAQGNVNDFMTLVDTRLDEIVRHPLVSRRLEQAPEMDLMGYNYMTARYEDDCAAYPQRVIVGSESYPPDIARIWPLVQRLPNVVGDFTWTGMDYIGEAGIGVPAYAPGEGCIGAKFPCQLAYCGDLDLTGFRRPLSYLREIVFGLRRDPYIAVQDPAHFGEPVGKTPWILSDCHACWSYPGMEGRSAVVEVYAPGDRVELFLNGRSLGTRPAGEGAGFRALFETDYHPGTLLAVCYAGGEELGRAQLSTAGPGVGFALEAEEPDPLGEGRLVYVDVTCRDALGRVADDGAVIRAEVTGGGELIAMGSADPKPALGYTGPETALFHGRGVLVLRRGEGEIRLTVTDAQGRRGELTLR